MRKEDKDGIWITVGIHLAVILFLLLSVVTPNLRKSSVFELDFSKLDEIEKLEKELEMKKQLNEKLNRLLQEQGIRQEDKNDRKSLAVDRSQMEIEQENARVQQQIRQSLDRGEIEGISFDDAQGGDKSQEGKSERYRGPSVISYDLGGRKASRLPIPAYKCLGAGEVTVIVVVDPQGNVVNAKIEDDSSSEDSCLRDFALTAALKAKFRQDASAPSRQRGSILYSFIAQ